MRKKIFGLMLLIGLILFWYFFINQSENSTANKPESTQERTSESSLITVKPDLTQNNVVAPTQPIELTFKQPVENLGEFKHEITPNIEYNLKISDDRKTVTISPKKTYPIGEGLTIKVNSDTKLDGGKLLGEDVIINFRTINYKGV